MKKKSGNFFENSMGRVEKIGFLNDCVWLSIMKGKNSGNSSTYYSLDRGPLMGTNVDPSVILEDEDYGLKVSINDTWLYVPTTCA